MLSDRAEAVPVEADPVPELRAIALRLGAALGWPPAEVASFAAKLADRPWDELEPEDLLRVIDEYERLAQAIAARRGRLTAPRTGGRRAVRA